MPVLAMITMEIATDPAEGITARTRQEMVEGFLLYRVNSFRSNKPVGRRIQCTFFINPDRTNAGLPLFYRAAVMTN
jgi:hypothetical protein